MKKSISVPPVQCGRVSFFPQWFPVGLVREPEHIPVLFLTFAGQPPTSFVTQGGGLERLPFGLLGQPLCRQLPQCFVDQRRELLSCLQIRNAPTLSPARCRVAFLGIAIPGAEAAAAWRY